MERQTRKGREPTLDYRVKISSLPLDDALQVRRDPSAVKVARLRLDPLAVDEALPRRPRVKRQVAAQRLKVGRRLLVRPDPVRHHRLAVPQRHLPVRRRTLPLAPCRAPGARQGRRQGRRREVVCCAADSHAKHAYGQESALVWLCATGPLLRRRGGVGDWSGGTRELPARPSYRGIGHVCTNTVPMYNHKGGRRDALGGWCVSSTQ